jgi:hypothetical protein
MKLYSLLFRISPFRISAEASDLLTGGVIQVVQEDSGIIPLLDFDPFLPNPLIFNNHQSQIL